MNEVIILSLELFLYIYICINVENIFIVSYKKL